MQVRNLLIAAGAVLAATTTIAAAPTAANAYPYNHPYRAHYFHRWAPRPVFFHRHFDRFHHRGFYRY